MPLTNDQINKQTDNATSKEWLKNLPDYLSPTKAVEKKANYFVSMLHKKLCKLIFF